MRFLAVSSKIISVTGMYLLGVITGGEINIFLLILAFAIAYMLIEFFYILKRQSE